MASSSSHEPASSTGGPVAESDGSKKTDELGAQISDLKKQQQDLLRDKKNCRHSFATLKKNKG